MKTMAAALGAFAACLVSAAPLSAAPRTGAPAAPAKTWTLPLDTFRDRLRGGWAGQMIGVSYGSIYEFKSNGAPITGPLRPWEPGFVANSLEQDDIYVEMTFLKTLEARGPKATRAQAGADFRDSRYRLWHANNAARENLRQGIPPPDSGHPRYNPHADDIDFQIEADLFGLVAPGMPRAAGRMCDVFGSVMNWGDGLYGGRFVTAMYCRAYQEPDPTPAAVRRCLDAGLASIPADSDYARILRDVIAGHKKNPGDWRKTWQALEDKWGGVDLCPTGKGKPFNIDAKLNGAYIALGLLYGGGDFARTLEITTRCGQDADCNPSNAAGVLGAIYGYRRLPAVYTRGIPSLDGKKFEWTDYDFPGLITACERVARRVVLDNGGRVTRRGTAEVLEIPVQRPHPPAKTEQMQAFRPEQIAQWAADYDRRLQAARTKAPRIGQWRPGWQLVATGDAMETGVMSYLGRQPVLATHPVSRTEPAAIERVLDIPAKKPRLRLTVTSSTENDAADWQLRVLVNGAVIDERVVHTPGKWQDITLDLAPYAGRQVTVRLENRAGGAKDWAWEAAYWARVDVLGG